MLEARGISSGYGDVTVLKELNFQVGNEILAVLGANGAGKSTLMLTIAGVLPLRAGTLLFQGDDISKTPAHVLASRGIALVPQEGNVFADLTVDENLAIGGLASRSDRDSRVDEVMTLFPALKDRRRQRAGTLSGGEAQMVAVGRALMQGPQMLLLDEPTAGLAPIYVDSFFEKIREIHETRDITIVLAEQNAAKAREISDRVLVLNLGEITMIGNNADLHIEQLKRGYGL
jgi:branched-chain amino acid transport system ATP-binding protein